jgi:multiple sugar transport system permease protein
MTVSSVLARVASMRNSRMSVMRRRQLWGVVFAVVPTLLYVVIMIIPMFFSFRLSLLDYNPLREVNPSVGLANYSAVLQDPDFIAALTNTFKFVAMRVPVIMVLALGVAFLLHRISRGKGFLRLLYLLPWITSGVAIAWMWNFAFNKPTGPINNLLQALGFARHAFLWERKLVLPSITLVSVWQGLGYYTLLFAAGLEGIPQVYYEAARVDGASRWQLFRKITLPLLNPTIVLVFVLCTISSLHQFDIFRNMTAEGRGGPLNAGLVLSLLVYMESFTALKMGRGAAITVIFLIITIVLTLIQLRFAQRRFDY